MTTTTKKSRRRFVVCIDNTGFEVSLERRKIYEVLPETMSAGGELIRVIDDTGEDYLYPRDMFLPIDLSSTVADALAS